MSSDIIKYAFTAGVITPAAHARTDLENYDLGLAEGENYFVDYRGGISNRTGTLFGDFMARPDKPRRFFSFRYSPNIADTFVILFGEGYVRFIQQNAYVLEATKSLSAVTAASPGVFTSNAHGYANGDLVRLFNVTGMLDLNNRSFFVANKTTNTFQLVDHFGVTLNTTGFPVFVSGSVARVLTLVSPFAADDLHTLVAKQNKNTLKFTSNLYDPVELTRAASGTWSITTVSLSNGRAAPTGLSGSASSGGAAGLVFGVTSVGFDGSESRVSDVLVATSIVNYSTTAGSYTLTWSPVANTAYYNVYRSNFATDGTKITKGAQLGYIGRTNGTDFTDSNIIPNFTISPPEHYDPFVNAGVSYIDITTGGTGYSINDTVSVSGGSGSGFTGYPVVNSAGSVTGIVVTFPGKGYTTPTVSITTSGGSGFAGVVHLTEPSGNRPSQSTIFQKRQIYASTINQPLTVWGSKPSLYNNFDVSRAPVDNDSYEFDLETEQVSGISHILATRGGLLLMSQIGVWLLSGANGGAVTPTSALAEPQSYTGVSSVPPLRIDTDFIYTESKGSAVRLLSYNDFSKVYGGSDISLLASHFFGRKKEIVSWDFAQEPFKLVYAVRADGKLLTLTIVKEQKVFAWTDNSTKGLFLDVIVSQESNVDTPYFMVEREIAGKTVCYFEQAAPRSYDHEEDSVFLDCALTLPINVVTTASLKAAASSGTNIVFEASANVFSSGDVGKFIRFGGGKAEVKTYVSPTVVRCDILRPIEDLAYQEETGKPKRAKAGEWTIDPAYSSVSGLWHLEGETVTILADGSVQPSQTVVNGKVTLETTASRAVAGLPYKSIARTLPITSRQGTVEGRRIRIVGTAVRLYESRGLQFGLTKDNLYPLKDRTNENYGDPTLMFSGYTYQVLQTRFDREGQTYYVQDKPLPVTILGLVADVEVGDDKG